jgi:hypothetical protein
VCVCVCVCVCVRVCVCACACMRARPLPNASWAITQYKKQAPHRRSHGNKPSPAPTHMVINVSPPRTHGDAEDAWDRPDERRQFAPKVRDDAEAGARQLRVELGVVQEGRGRLAGFEQFGAQGDARSEGQERISAGLLALERPRHVQGREHHGDDGCHQLVDRAPCACTHVIAVTAVTGATSWSIVPPTHAHMLLAHCVSGVYARYSLTHTGRIHTCCALTFGGARTRGLHPRTRYCGSSCGSPNLNPKP